MSKPLKYRKKPVVIEARRGERMSVTITDEMIEAGLWAWILNATEGVARENVSQRVIDLNWHRAEATITAVLPLIEQAVRDRAADEIDRLNATIQRVRELAEKMQDEQGQSWNSISGNRIRRALEGGDS